MRCPYCKEQESKVVDSRETDESVRRRRECLSCGQRYTTYERVESNAIFVVKKDGRREEYNRAKLVDGIRKACAKRPVSAEAIDRLVDEVEAGLFKLGKAEVHSVVIGEKVMNLLRDLDEVAYVRFASVYRRFTDLDGLKEEIDEFRRWKKRQAETKNQLQLPIY